MTDKRKKCLEALEALYLVVETDIADDVKHKVLAALHEAEELTDEQVEKIYRDGVYENPEFHKWEAEHGAVTRLANQYMEQHKAIRNTEKALGLNKPN